MHHRFLWRLPWPSQPEMFHALGDGGAIFQAILENQYHDGVVVEALSFFEN